MAGSPAVVNADTTYEGQARTTRITRDGRVMGAEAVYRNTVTAPVYRVDRGVRWETRPVVIVDCTTLPGEGRGDWRGFYNVPRDQKAAALAAAIRGIGLPSAQQIVAARVRYFEPKPRTWNEFRAVINQIDRDLNLGIGNNVLVTYGNDNAKNLGYYAEETCTRRTVTELVLVPYEMREFAYNKALDVTLVVSGAVLLSMENESFDVTYDGENASLSADSRYNRYTQLVYGDARRGEVTFKLAGIRYKVQPGNTLSLLMQNRSSGVVVSVADQAYDPALGADAGQTVVVIEVRKKNFVGSSLVSKIERVVSLTNGLTEVVTGITPPAGKKSFVRYAIKRIGARYYNDQASPSRDSDSVQF